MGHSEYDAGLNERRAWNAGRKLGAKRALKPQQVWAIRFWLDSEQRVREERCLIWRSTASCAAATSKRSGSATLSVAAGSALAQSSYSARPADPFSLNSLSL